MTAGGTTGGAVHPEPPAGAASGSRYAFADVAWPRVSRPSDLARIVDWSGAELSVAVRDRVVTCVEVMMAYLDHIDRVNPRVNAIVGLRPRPELLAEAAQKDDLLAGGTHQGWMHGFPQAVKDLADVAGLPTTRGFFRPPFAAAPAVADSVHVERIRAAGAIVIGKTNTPEFGLGSHTDNDVHGRTVNAYDQTRSAGGSSGGAAVAVALRMLPVADGSDFFGSLRNPPGWNNVLGIRPSFGRVPADNVEGFVHQGATDGPIARTALDLALLLRTMSGYDPRAPLSLTEDPARLTALDPASIAGRRAVWFGDLGGYLPMDPEVLAVCRSAVDTLAAMGVEVTTQDELPTAEPFRGTADLWPTWLVLRHWLAGATLMPFYDDPTHRAAMKPEALYEVEGLLTGADGNPAVTAMDVYAASAKRTGLFKAFQQLFASHDFALFPTAQLFPFEAALTWPRTVNGVPMSSYHRWMEVTSIGTLINAPTLAVPAGFGRAGLPIGLQVIARDRDDFSLMSLAAAWEARTGWVERHRPPLLGT